MRESWPGTRSKEKHCVEVYKVTAEVESEQDPDVVTGKLFSEEKSQEAQEEVYSLPDFVTEKRFSEEKYQEAQEEVYSLLIQTCSDYCFATIQGVEAHDEDCGTKVWDKLLRRYEATLTISRVRLTLDAIEACGTFNEVIQEGKDTDAYMERLETYVQRIQNTGKAPTLQEILIALIISSMAGAGAYWETQSVLLAEKEDLTIDRAKDYLRESFIRKAKTGGDKGSANAIDVSMMDPSISAVKSSNGDRRYQIKGSGEIYNNYFEAYAVVLKEKNASLEKSVQDASRKRCDNCPKLFNHWTSECRKKGKDRDVSKLTCYRCGKLGHLANKCEEEVNEKKYLGVKANCNAKVVHEDMPQIQAFTVTRRERKTDQHTSAAAREVNALEVMGDSGANVTVLESDTLLVQGTVRDTDGYIEVAKGGSKITNLKEGDFQFTVRTRKNKPHSIKVPAIASEQVRRNLLSLDQLSQMGYTTVLKASYPYIRTPGNEKISLKRKNGQYYLDCEVDSASGAPEKISIVRQQDEEPRRAYNAYATENNSEIVTEEIDHEEVKPAKDPNSLTGRNAVEAVPDMTEEQMSVEDEKPKEQGCKAKNCKHKTDAQRDHEIRTVRFWHRKFGHLNIQQLVELSKITEGMPDLTGYAHRPCRTCMRCKSKRKKRSKKAERKATRPLERVYCDYAGPFRNPSSGGAYYYLVFVDCKTRVPKVYLARTRSQFIDLFRKYCADVGGTPEMLRSDNAPEMVSGEAEEFFANLGVRREKSAPHAQHQNGVPERCI